MLVLFSCKAGNTDSGTSGDNPTNSKSPDTSKPIDPPATSELPSGGINSDFIGIWGNVNASDWHNYSTGAYAFTSGKINSIEFKADGTFKCVVVGTWKTIVVVTEHKGSFNIGESVPDPSDSGLMGNIFHLTNVMVKETVYSDNILNQNETFDWKSVPDHNLICGFLNNINEIWFGPYQFEYKGSGDYRVELTGMDRVIE